jgi:hypothetical protein
VLQDFPGHVVRAYCHEPRAPSTLAAQVQTTRAAAACSTRCGAWPEQTVDVPPSPCSYAPSRTLRAGTKPTVSSVGALRREAQRLSWSARGLCSAGARCPPGLPAALPGPQSRGWYGGGGDAGVAGKAPPPWLKL